MPEIYRFHCSSCRLEFPMGWGRNMYAIAPDGRREICPHPGEFYGVEQITGLPWSEADEKNLTGVFFDCVCTDCLDQFQLDWNLDERKCPTCKGANVTTVEDLVGQKCPQCSHGRIVKESTGLIS